MRSEPSWARVKPAWYQRPCTQAPRTKNAAAVLHSRRNGNQSKTPLSWVTSASAAHSDGSHGDVGVRSTVTKSTRSRNSSGRTRRSGRRNRKSATTPAAEKSATRASRSRVRRAGKTFTSRRVSAVPVTAGTTRKGSTVAAASA